MSPIREPGKERLKVGQMPKPYFTNIDTPQGTMKIPGIEAYGIDGAIHRFVGWTDVTTGKNGKPIYQKDKSGFSTPEGRRGIASHIAQSSTLFGIELAVGPAINREADFSKAVSVPLHDDPDRVTLYIKPEHIAVAEEVRWVYVGRFQAGHHFDMHGNELTPEQVTRKQELFQLYRSRIPEGNAIDKPYHDPKIEVVLSLMPEVPTL